MLPGFISLCVTDTRTPLFLPSIVDTVFLPSIVDTDTDTEIKQSRTHTQAVLVASVPGVHTGGAMGKYGAWLISSRPPIYVCTWRWRTP